LAQLKQTQLALKTTPISQRQSLHQPIAEVIEILKATAAGLQASSRSGGGGLDLR
jgi:uncharacterized protein YqgV (UPF0045/DUF77 family)